MYIYQIRNILDGKSYVGSTQNFERRKGTHISELKNNKHYNNYLQNAWNKYGEENFEFNILFTSTGITRDMLYEIEKKYVIEMNLCNELYGYNISDVVKQPPSRKGIPLSEEHKKRIGDSNKGKKATEETKLKLSISHKGYKRSEESKLKTKENAKNNPNFGMRGKHLSEDTKKNISEFMKIRPHTEESRIKRRMKLKGKPRPQFSEEWIKNLSEAHKGYKFSEESKKKLSNSLKGRTRTKEHQEKLNRSLSKPIMQFSKEGEFIKEYISLAEAEKLTGCGKSSICNYLKGKSKTSYGFIWKYKNEENIK